MNSGSDEGFCEICNQTYNSRSQYEGHISGKSHAKMLANSTNSAVSLKKIGATIPNNATTISNAKSFVAQSSEKFDSLKLESNPPIERNVVVINADEPVPILFPQS